ncbi:MAG: BlaI/MecI/CopY family transcriptional regulator [Planctomycetota bacterium]
MTDDLPDAELDVLATLWSLGPATARAVREALEGRRPMTHGATFTLLTRLEGRGYVERTGDKVGKAFVYRARVRPGRTHRRKVRELADRLFDGDGVSLVRSLFESKPPTPDELERLQEILDRHREEGGR